MTKPNLCMSSLPSSGYLREFVMNSRNPSPQRVWRGLQRAARGGISGDMAYFFLLRILAVKKGSKSFSSPQITNVYC